MSERRPPSDEQIDQLVRAHLARQEREVDAPKVLAGVRRRLGSGLSRLPLPAWRRWGWRAGATAAAILLLAILSTIPFVTRSATAETWVRQAQEAHAQPVDRCYLVQIEADPSLKERYRLLPWNQRENRLWTRGDRFWMELNRDRSWAWGRDEQGRVWFAGGRRFGFRFEPDEVPEQLAVASELGSMQVERLLREVQGDDFELHKGPAEGSVQVIEARLNPGMSNPRLRGVRLEIDSQSKVLRKVMLQRLHKGRPAATVTFTLAETVPQDDASYRLEGHLDPNAKVFNRDHLMFRLLLQKQLGGPAKP